MSRDLDTMTQIVNEKEKDIEASELQPMNPEGRYMAEHKRFTFDVVDVPTDPLR
jgi:hypothetical protein